MTSIAILEAVNTTAVQFHGQPIITAMVAGVAYVAMRPIVENIGIDWAGQTVKLRNQKEKFNCCDISMVAADKKKRDFLCIPLRKLNGWLFSINPERVRADIKDKLIQYQEECFAVLHAYWTTGEVKRKASTTTDDRTPLRDAINMLVGKKGIMYPEAYSFIHQRFNVAHIDELEADQLPVAVEYVHRLVLEGEYLGKQEALPAPSLFTDEELSHLCWLRRVADTMQKASKEMYPALRDLGSKYSAICFDMARESGYTIDNSREVLSRATQHIDPVTTTNINLRYVLPQLRQQH